MKIKRQRVNNEDLTPYPLTPISRSNGATTTYAYDGENRVTGVAHNASGSAIANMTYTRDAVGNIVSESGTLPRGYGVKSSLLTSIAINEGSMGSIGSLEHS